MRHKFVLILRSVCTLAKASLHQLGFLKPFKVLRPDIARVAQRGSGGFADTSDLDGDSFGSGIGYEGGGGGGGGGGFGEMNRPPTPPRRNAAARTQQEELPGEEI